MSSDRVEIEVPAPEAGPSTTKDESGEKKPQPVVVIVIGMAGSGKTTLMQRLNSYLHSQVHSTPDSTAKAPYILNLDPAVANLPYEANIDIRDTVDYKEVMKQYNLGPNGGILTALNLFTTKFDQVLGFVEKRAESVDHILIDTPGQIEIFTWSASGSIITEAIASSLPTVVAYVIDTPRTIAPVTFMSNMLYACSILYKTRLPFILVFNKVDIQPHDFALNWMEDWQAFQAALHDPQYSSEGSATGESSYMSSLMGSMCLVLDEFYSGLRSVGVSAMTGQGMKAFFEKVDEAREEYEAEYRPELEKAAKAKAEKRESEKQEQLERLMKDLQGPSGSASGGSKSFRRGAGPNDNPFGPHGRNEREDRHYDDDMKEAGRAGFRGGEDDGDVDSDEMVNDDELGPDAERVQPGPGADDGFSFGGEGIGREGGWRKPA